MSFGKYQFLSWARRGVAVHIAERDTLGKTDGVAVERVRLPVKVKLNSGEMEQHLFALTGPGDVTGISDKTIIRTEPLNGIADYEPNLLPYIEFYDEDFPYRYTPASPAAPGTHLRPWLALVVLKENEFLETKRREPLTSIQIVNDSVLPPHDQLHLWCHMHSNLPHEESRFEEFLDGLEEDVKTDPDGVYSRLLCPRKLEPRTLYHAFLVPAYETGRRAGLGQPITDVKVQTPAWPGQGNELPVYYRWYFRTGKNFDFEYLVKQLQPRIMDERVGVREMDCSRPAFVRSDVNAEVRAPRPEVMLLGGAVMAPDANVSSFPADAVAQPFLDDMEKLVNLNRLQQENPDTDPFVSVPYYGMYHAMRRNNSLPGRREVPPFDPGSARWYNDLNRDPRNRVPAGFGKRVVQENQEKFVDLAWKQLSDVLEANERMRFARFASEVLGRVYARTLSTRANESFLALANPMSRRVLMGNKTVKSAVDSSLVANATVDAAFSRMVRGNSSLTRGLNRRPRSAPFSYDSMLRKTNRVNGLSAEVAENFRASPRLANVTTFVAPTSASRITVWSRQSNLDATSAFIKPEFIGGLPQVNLWSSIVDTTRFPVAPLAPVAPVAPGVRVPTVRASRTPIRPVPILPDIRITPRPVPEVTPITPRPLPEITPVPPQIGVIESAIANNRLDARVHNAQVRAAYAEVSQRFGFAQAQAKRRALNAPAVRTTLDKAIRPDLAYERYANAIVRWPGGIFRPPREKFLPAMAYPDIPEPTYKHLVNIDKEFLLPNLHLIENNTVSLLKTNQKFIESYLVGLNYEMGRELLWREYPTDMRGSYFRQFWDVSGFVTPDTTAQDADALKDIRPIHTWSNSSVLGKHNARDPEGDTEQLVFVIRGDLLKKFPNTVIYAQKALRDPDSTDAGKTVIRSGEMSDAQYEKEIRFPLYQAEIEPDIKLLGFNLTIDEAAGVAPTPGFGNDRRGWYFVLAEVPGEPRFGMDINFRPNDTSHLTWNDLSWENLPEGTRFVRADEAPSLRVAPGTEGRWAASSSHMAGILLQRPVMVAIHAQEMLDVAVPPELDYIKTPTLREYIARVRFNPGRG